MMMAAHLAVIESHGLVSASVCFRPQIPLAAVQASIQLSALIPRTQTSRRDSIHWQLNTLLFSFPRYASACLSRLRAPFPLALYSLLRVLTLPLRSKLFQRHRYHASELLDHGPEYLMHKEDHIEGRGWKTAADGVIGENRDLIQRISTSLTVSSSSSSR